MLDMKFQTDYRAVLLNLIMSRDQIRQDHKHDVDFGSDAEIAYKRRRTNNSNVGAATYTT